MGMNFENMREVFVHHGMNNKNLSHILHRFHQLGESKPSLSPIFQVSWFFLFWSRFCESCFGEMEMNLEKLKEVFFSTGSYTKTSPCFYTDIS
jgi:hypothetical protein